MSLANWISISTCGPPRPYCFGEISIFVGLCYGATWYQGCSYPVARLQTAALFVFRLAAGIFPHDLGHFFYSWDLSGTSIAAIRFLGSSLRLCPLFAFASLGVCDLFGGHSRSLGPWERFRSLRQTFSYRLKELRDLCHFSCDLLESRD